MLKWNLVCQFNNCPTEIVHMHLTERLANDWTSAMYAFFEPHPSIKTVDSHRCHVFKCAIPDCKGKGPNPHIVWRFLDTGNRKSTSNMHKHAKQCWGEGVVSEVDQAKASSLDLSAIQAGLAAAKKLRDGSIMASFERKGKGKHLFHTPAHLHQNTVYFTLSYHPCSCLLTM